MGVVADNLALRFACFVVEPRNTTHPLVVVQRRKGTAFLHHPALDQSVSNRVMGVCKELRTLVRGVAFQTFQHGENTVLFIVQEPLRVVFVQPLPQEEIADPSIQARLYVMQEVGKKAEIMPCLRGNDILIDRIQFRRRGRELVHMGDFKHGKAVGISLKRIFCKSLFHSLTTSVISNSSAPPPAAPPVSFPLRKNQRHTPGQRWRVPACSSPAASSQRRSFRPASPDAVFE